MIKLFWNTHNQIIPLGKTNNTESVNFMWGNYHKKNSDKWIFEILKKIQFKLIESVENVENKDVIIVIDSSIETKIEFYNKLKLLCSKIFLIHLGDESGMHNLAPVYDNCNYVWRTFCSNKYFKNAHISCIPIGYKSGTIFNSDENKYKWAFVGTPHKSSRHDMLFQFSSIQPFYCHITQKFDQKIISVDEMSEVLSSTQFLPCPNGFFHPETYRLYEALQCGCIPIVEDAYNYYDRLFPNNPFIKIGKWAEAKPLMNGWEENQIKKKQEDCINWWGNYKSDLQNFIKNKIA